MNNGRRITFKLFAIVFFLMAILNVLAILFAASGSGRSPGLFLALMLAGIGKWLLGKSQGTSARETFGRVIEVVDTDDLSEMADRPRGNTQKW